MIDFNGSHFERDVILWGVRWYVAYPMSYRQLEEMMEERGVEVDHSTLNRWVVKYAPLLEKQFRARKRAIGSSWRLDETYVKVKGCCEISVSGRRQRRRDSRFSVDRQEGSQSRVAFPA
jgi:transposase-like protein